MVTTIPSGTTILIIDTEQYAGYFAEELCAYVSGRVGANNIGEDYAILYQQETEAEPITQVHDVSDEKGICTPCSIWPTLGWFNNGAGGNYRTGQESLAISDYRKYVLQERSNLIKQKQIILSELTAGKTIGNWTKEKAEEEIRKHEDEIKEVREITRIKTYPAYLSVAIFFRPTPSEITMDFIKVRAFQYIEIRKEVDQTRKDTLNIAGFRTMRVQAQKKLVTA